MVQKSEDPFLARLERLESPAPKRVVETPNYPRDAQSSVLLPIAAMFLLIVGGGAFSMMMVLPDPSGASLASTTIEMLSNRP